MSIQNKTKTCNLNIRINTQLRSLIKVHAKGESVSAAHWIRESIIEKLLSEGVTLESILSVNTTPPEAKPIYTTTLLD